MSALVIVRLDLLPFGKYTREGAKKAIGVLEKRYDVIRFAKPRSMLPEALLCCRESFGVAVEVSEPTLGVRRCSFPFAYCLRPPWPYCAVGILVSVRSRIEGLPFAVRDR